MLTCSQDWEGLLPDTCVSLLNLERDSSNPTKINYVRCRGHGNKDQWSQTRRPKMELGKCPGSGIRKLEFRLRGHAQVCRRHLHCAYPASSPAAAGKCSCLPPHQVLPVGLGDRGSLLKPPELYPWISYVELREVGSLCSAAGSGIPPWSCFLHVEAEVL